MKMIHNFVLESEEIHFNYQIDLLNKTNYMRLVMKNIYI